MKNRRFCRRVARHGLILGGTEAHHLQEAFARPPGPPGPQKQAKIDAFERFSSNPNVYILILEAGVANLRRL